MPGHCREEPVVNIAIAVRSVDRSFEISQCARILPGAVKNPSKGIAVVRGGVPMIDELPADVDELGVIADCVGHERDKPDQVVGQAGILGLAVQL